MEKSILPAPKELLSLDEKTFPQGGYTEEELRAAQSAVGALLWLSQRTRPDLCYVVSVMGTMVTKDPVRVVKIANKTMAYINATKNYKLHYETGCEKEVLEIFTDSSCAPDGAKSHGGSGAAQDNQ